MKKQILIFGTIIISLGLFSCSKENVEKPQTSNATENVEQRNTSTPNSEFTLDPILTGLKGAFEFNDNLKEKAGRLPNGVAVYGRVSYVPSRKATAMKAVQFNGYLGIHLPSVPMQTNMSIAVWVKYSSTTAPLTPLVYGDLGGPGFAQELNKYWGLVTTPMTSGVESVTMDNKWHHLAVTYNGTEMKFYVDGKFVGASANPGQLGPVTTIYKLGYFVSATDTLFWKGCMDDLYIYNRTLSASDVLKLYNL